MSSTLGRTGTALRDDRAMPLGTAPGPLEDFFLEGGGRFHGLERYGALAARVLISQIFLLSGVMKIVNWSETAEQMAGRGMFWVPFFLAAATVVELAAGLSLLLGLKARAGALLLFLYLIPVTLVFHNFW